MEERYWLLTASYTTGMKCFWYGLALHTLNVIHVSKRWR